MAGSEVLYCSGNYLLASMDISLGDYETGRTPSLEGAVRTETGTVDSVDEAFEKSCSPDSALEEAAGVGLSIEMMAGSSQT